MEIFSTCKGKPCIALDGFLYRLQIKRGLILRWQCLREKQEKCRGSLKTDLEYNLIVDSKTDHTCVPNETEVQLKKFREICLKRIKEEASTPPSKIYKQEVAKILSQGGDLAASLPSYDIMKTTLCKYRRIMLGTEPKRGSEAEIFSRENNSNEPLNTEHQYSEASTATGPALSLDSIENEVILPDDYDANGQQSSDSTASVSKPSTTMKKPRTQTTPTAITKNRNLRIKSNRSDSPKQDTSGCSDSVLMTKSKEDRFYVFGMNVACKLRDMDKEQRIRVEKIINDALFEGEMGRITDDHGLINASQLQQYTVFSSPYTDI